MSFSQKSSESPSLNREIQSNTIRSSSKGYKNHNISTISVDNNDMHDDDHDITAVGKSRNKTPERRSLMMNKQKNSDENDKRRLDRSADTDGVVGPLVSALSGRSRGRGSSSSSNIRSTKDRSSSKGLKSSKLDCSLDRIEEEGKLNHLNDDQQQHEAVGNTVFFKNDNNYNDVDNMKSLTPLHKFRTYRMLTSISPTTPTNNDHQQQQYDHDYIADTNRLSTIVYTATDNKNNYKSNDDNDNDEDLPLQPRSTYIPVRPKSSNAALRSDANVSRRSAISRPQSSGIVRTKRGDTAASATTTTTTVASTRSQLYHRGAAAPTASTMRSFPSHFNTQLVTTTATLSSPSSSSPRSSSKLTTIPSSQKLFYSPTTDSPRFQINNSSSSFDHRQNNHYQQQQQHRHHQNPSASTDE